MSRWVASAIAAAAIASSTTTVRADDVPGSADLQPLADVPRLPPTRIESPPVADDLAREDRGWLRVVGPTAISASMGALADEASHARAELAAVLGVDVLDHLELRVARTSEEMAILSPREAPPPSTGSYAAYPSLHLVVIVRSAAAPSEDVVASMRHALAHVALFDAVAGYSTPAWFDEAFAAAIASEASFSDSRTLAGAVYGDRLVPISHLDRRFDEEEAMVARVEGVDFVRFLTREDRGRFARSIARVRVGDGFETAFARGYGRDLRALEDAWRSDVAHRFVRTPLYVAAGIGWGLAVVATFVAIRRRRRAAFRRSIADLRARALERAAAEAEKTKLVCVEARDGGVVFLEPKVPTVEHDGKVHTLH